MAQGLPTCSCGGQMLPSSPADLAWLGLIGIDDMSARDWTIVCRENGWGDMIVRRGAAAKAHAVRELEAGGFAGRRIGAAHCANPGCGRWISDGAEHCTAGHPQRSEAPAVAAMPF
jgi:hypothetical protein